MAQPNPKRPPRPVELHVERFPDRGPFDTAVSHAMLRRVAAGALPESLRLYQPDEVVLFSSLDARRPGFRRAVEIATEAGFDSAIRLAGGHAAIFLEEAMAFAWAIPDAEARTGIRSRFEALSRLVVAALINLGLDARVGEVSGEYCPGEFSVNIGGDVKVMGVGQRVIQGGAHVGGVITVGQTERLRAVLIPVYEALGIEFSPNTAGGVRDFLPRLGVDDIVAAMRDAFEISGANLNITSFDNETLATAAQLVSMHEVEPSPERPGSASRGARLRALDAKTLLQADPHSPTEAGDPQRRPSGGARSETEREDER